mmetsp:Transcript_46074/g.129651  ORF Transcript_46074/g.129651 Transcript_46074/m.129651 type:complete len:244 (-) Transcript_46074:724-1455(-)
MCVLRYCAVRRLQDHHDHHNDHHHHDLHHDHVECGGDDHDHDRDDAPGHDDQELGRLVPRGVRHSPPGRHVQPGELEPAVGTRRGGGNHQKLVVPALRGGCRGPPSGVHPPTGCAELDLRQDPRPHREAAAGKVPREERGLRDRCPDVQLQLGRADAAVEHRRVEDLHDHQHCTAHDDADLDGRGSDNDRRTSAGGNDDHAHGAEPLRARRRAELLPGAWRRSAPREGHDRHHQQRGLPPGLR